MMTLRVLVSIFVFSTSLLSTSLLGSSISESWYMSQGQSNLEIKNFKAASEAYEKAIELNPNNCDALKNLGVSFDQQGLIDRAVATYEKYLVQRPEDSTVLFRLANILSWDRYRYRRAESIKYFERGLRLQDQDTERRRLAKILSIDKKNMTRAVEEYRLLIKRSPEDEQLRKEFRIVLLGNSAYMAETISEFESEHAKHPDEVTTSRTLALLYLNSHLDDTKGLLLSENVIKKNPRDRELLLARARSFAKKRNFDEAEKSFASALSIRDEAKPREELGDVIAAQAGRGIEALKHYRVVLKSNPKRDDVYVKIGNALLKDRGTAEEAILSFDSALNLNPNNSKAHAGLSKAYAWTGQKDLALFHAQRAEQYGYPKQEDIEAVAKDMIIGREAGAGTHLISDIGHQGNFQRSYRAISIYGNYPVLAFLDAKIEGGYEHLASQFGLFKERSVEGHFEKASIAARAPSIVNIEAGITYRDIARGDRPMESSVGLTSTFWRHHHLGIHNSQELRTETVLAAKSVSDHSSEREENSIKGGIRQRTYQSDYGYDFDGHTFKGRITRAMMESLGKNENQFTKYEADYQYYFDNKGEFTWTVQSRLGAELYDHQPSEFPSGESVYQASEYLIDINTLFGFRWCVSPSQEFHLVAGPYTQLNQPFYGAREFKVSGLLSSFWQYRAAHDKVFQISLDGLRGAKEESRYSTNFVAGLLF